jgi:hypothetical protein
MPYTINKTSGDQVAVVADGTIDSTLDIKLIGKNYAGYGEIQNENFVKLLENFAYGSPPSKPIRGQIWFDSSNKKLKFFDGTYFRTTGGAETGNTEPPGLTVGDFWWDTDNKQLYAYNGTTFTLIGPQSAGTQQTEMVSRLVVDTLGGSHAVICATVNGVVSFIVSTETVTFTLKDTVNAIDGFTDVHPGITLRNTNNPAAPGQTTPPIKFYGTATNADLLGGYPASSFVQASSATFNTQVEFADPGFTVGLATKKLQVSINPGGNPVFQSNTNTMIFQTTVASVTKIPLKLIGNDILPDTDGNSNIGSNTFKYNTVYANQFEGIATQANSLTLAGTPRTASTAINAGTPTIAARDAVGDLYATTFRGTATAAQYADLAEKYLADKEYEVGTVVSVGGEKEVTACNWGDRALGVVSEKPAFKMNEGLVGGTYIALRGRVPVKVKGPVTKGMDLYPAADGVARAIANDENNIAFAIALESSDNEGIHLVEAVIL